jgi:general secretion pathway protein L
MSFIEKIQDDWNTWYEGSSLNVYLSWWKQQLKLFVPAKYQSTLFIESQTVYLFPNNEEIDVWYKENQNHDIERFINESDEDEMWWHQVQHIINRADGRPVSIEYILPNNRALVRKVALPIAAKENLVEVIGFELDKYVPFKADQVQLSYKINNEIDNTDKIMLDLAVVPKEQISSIIKLCDEKAIALNGIDIDTSKSNTPKKLGVNLLPRNKRKAKDYTNLKINVVLLFLLSALVYFVMHTSVVNKQNKIQILTEQNSELQKLARDSKLLKKELKEVIVSSKFLQNEKKEIVPIVTLMSDLTEKLPNHTFITRLRVTDETLEIGGHSDNANSLIPKLDESSLWFSPQFKGSVRPDSRTGKEIYTIQADLKETVEGEENVKSS